MVKTTAGRNGKGARTALAWFLVLLGLPAWELLRRLSGVSPLLMPSLSDIGRALLHGLRGGQLLAQVGLSLGFIVAGTLIASILALLVSLLTRFSLLLDSLVAILSSLFHPLPGIALLPVIILWVGIGPAAVLAVIVHSVFWPVLTNLRTGQASLPLTWRLLAENYQLGPLRYLFLIALPASSPYILAGLRIAWARAWRALISAEMLFGAVTALGGLGWFIHSRRVFMDSAGLYAGIVTVMLVGSLIEGLLFDRLEAVTLGRWGMMP